MHRTSSARPFAATIVAGLVLLAMSACGSTGSSGSSDPTSTTAAETASTGPRTTSTASEGDRDTTSSGGAKPGATASTTRGASPTTRSGDGGADGSLAYDGPGGGGPCSPDADRLSGTSTVMWTADSAAKHKTSEATTRTTLLIQKDGSVEPSTLTVQVGEVFTFGLAAGVSDIVSVKVGCDSGQTVLAGDPLAGEYITTAGTYDVVNIVANKQVGTITAK